MLEKIISGGQTGADRGALIAAKVAGLKTGGWMPFGFLALDGNHPEFAQEYGMDEHRSPNYQPRTRCNVRDSDATLRFASNWHSTGERATLKAIKDLKKPYMDIDVRSPEWMPSDVATWITLKRIKILNIAGNAESNSPGIQAIVIQFMSEVFKILSPEPPLSA